MTDPAFERIALQYGDMLYRVAFNYLKSREDSEDAVQNTLIRLYRCRRDFDSEEHLRAWLIRVVINESKRILSRRNRRAEVSLESVANELYADADNHELFIELMRLKPRDGTVLYLYYFEGYRTEEIAKMMSRSDAAVRQMLSRARKQLRTQLEVELDEPSE